MDARACPRCSMALSPVARFCRRCGTPQAMGAAAPRVRGEVTVHVIADRTRGRRRPRFAPTFRVAALALVVLGSLLGVSPFGGGQVAAAEPKVVVIVGPVGAITPLYRSDAEKGAAEARRFTHNVVTLYSPDATWPAVRAALQGASLVIYLGHGNGWPSPYSSRLVPASQDGLGLNPVAGGGDSAHQYFGEAYLAREVHLAPHALVLLHHLCYASGNSEPGLPEGSLATALLRADNFAAGWLAAGADAVLADASDGPAYYVRSILSGSSTIEAIWRSSPSFHGHLIARASQRTPGMSELLDPDRPSSGFHRSLVGRLGLRGSELAAAQAAGLDAGGVVSGPAAAGLTLAGSPVAGTRVPVRVTFASKTALPAGIKLGLRWDALALDPPPGVDATAAPGTTGSPSPTPSPKPTPAPASASAPSAAPHAGDAAATPASAAPGPSDAAAADPAASLVQPEVPGAVVLVSATAARPGGLETTAAVPARPGLYRLVVTLHGADGVAFDAATQARLPALIVRVTGTLSATLAAPANLSLVAGTAVVVPVTVANTGTVAWQEQPLLDPGRDGPLPPEAPHADLVARWVLLEPDPGPFSAVALEDARAPIRLDPGASVPVELTVKAPDQPGRYLLLLDIASPLYGSLTARGMPPVTIRATVAPATDAARTTAGPR